MGDRRKGACSIKRGGKGTGTAAWRGGSLPSSICGVQHCVAAGCARTGESRGWERGGCVCRRGEGGRVRPVVVRRANYGWEY